MFRCCMEYDVLYYSMKHLPLTGAACASGRAAAHSLCVEAVGGGPSGLISDEIALEVCTRCAIQIDAFTFYCGHGFEVGC